MHQSAMSFVSPLSGFRVESALPVRENPRLTRSHINSVSSAPFRAACFAACTRIPSPKPQLASRTSAEAHASTSAPSSDQELLETREDVAERKKKIQAAAKNGTLTFGFSAGGLVYPYFIGVVGALRELGLMTG